MTDEELRDIELRIPYLFHEGFYFEDKSTQEIVETDMRILIAEVGRLRDELAVFRELTGANEAAYIFRDVAVRGTEG